jgi:hypothetical protein
VFFCVKYSVENKKKQMRSHKKIGAKHPTRLGVFLASVKGGEGPK